METEDSSTSEGEAQSEATPAAESSAEPPEPPAPDAEPLATIPVQEPPADAPAEADAGTQLEDITVTATKREKSAREIPVTVNAYTGEDLIRRGATNLEELVKLQAATTKNGNRLVMRGIATSALGTYATSEEVGRFLGDMSLLAPSTRGALPDLDPFDLQGIEVAKGPQATLFGGTALAGAIRYIPAPPDLSGFSGGVRAGWGPVEHSEEPQKETAAMLNVAIGDSLGFRGVGSWRRRPGLLDDLHADRVDTNWREQQQGRVLGLWEPTPDLSVNATYLAWTEDEGDLGFSDRPDRYETRIQRIPQPSYMDASARSLRAEYRWESVSLIGMGSLLKSWWFDIVDLAPALGTEDAPGEYPLAVTTEAYVPSYEVRLVSNEPAQSSWWVLNDWEYLIGAFQMAAEQYVENRIIARNPPLPDAVVDQRAHSDTVETAVFFDVTRSFFDKQIELNLGGRLADSTVDVLTYLVEGGQRAREETHKVEERRFNPKAALTWRWSSDFSIYASVAQGFRYGGANATPTAEVENIPRTFKSDTIWNYEAGVRSDWSDRTLRVDVTGFQIDWTDLQIVQISDSAQNYVDNVGGARVRGAEGKLLWQLPDDLPLVPAGFAVSLGGSYMDSRTTEPFDSARGPVEPGTRMPLTPRVMANGGIAWAGGIGSWLAGASITNAYVGVRKNELINTVTMPEFQSLGATLTLGNPGMRFSPEFTLNGNNLLDDPALHFAVPARAGSNKLYVLNRSRTVLLNVQLAF